LQSLDDAIHARSFRSSSASDSARNRLIGASRANRGRTAGADPYHDKAVAGRIMDGLGWRVQAGESLSPPSVVASEHRRRPVSRRPHGGEPHRLAAFALLMRPSPSARWRHCGRLV